MTPVMVAEENDLIHVGDVLIGAALGVLCAHACLKRQSLAPDAGVSGLLIAGMSLAQILTTLTTARVTMPGGGFGEPWVTEEWQAHHTTVPRPRPGH